MEGRSQACGNKNSILGRDWHEMRPEVGKAWFTGGSPRRPVWQEEVVNYPPSEDEGMGREDVRLPSFGGVRGIGAYRGLCGAPLPSDMEPKKLHISVGGTGQVRLCIFGINTDSKTWFWHKESPKGNVTSSQCLPHGAAKFSLFLSKTRGQVRGWAEGILANPGQAWRPQRLRGMCDQLLACRHSLQAREEKNVGHISCRHKENLDQLDPSEPLGH